MNYFKKIHQLRQAVTSLCFKYEMHVVIDDQDDEM
jgi:hypothetical protein